jgi:DNA-binding response OmpR family regulator
MAKKTLLVVDDDRSIRSGLEMLFEGDYAVSAVERGCEALSLMREKAPDVMLLDIGLPDMSGIDLLDRIKSWAPETVVVMMTAAEERGMIDRARELGAADYLVKPIDAKALKAALQNAVQGRGRK